MIVIICFTYITVFIFGIFFGYIVFRMTDHKDGNRLNILPKLPHRKHELSLEEKQLQTFIENIEAYDGTNLGQKEIPNK